MLTRRSENATVTLCHTGTADLAAHVRNADIVVAAAGVPGIITADMVKPGAAVLDVGVSRVDGKIAGDVADDVWEVAGWVSPNPGGVGPMTRAMLLSNIVSIAEQQAVSDERETEPIRADGRRRGGFSPTRRWFPARVGGIFYLVIVMARDRRSRHCRERRLAQRRTTDRGCADRRCGSPTRPARTAGGHAGRAQSMARRRDSMAALGAAIVFLASSIPNQPPL